MYAVSLASRTLSKFKSVVKSGDTSVTEPDSRDSRTDHVHIYSGLWSMFDDFGGMTSAVIRRTNSFLTLGNAKSATILTFAPNGDAEPTQQRIMAMGIMHEATTIRNLWSELRTWPDERLSTLEGDPASATLHEATGNKFQLSDHYTLYRDPETNETIRHEHYRDDGSLLLVDTKTEDGQRLLVLYSSIGEPITQWVRARDLYKQWVTTAIARRPAVFIVDAGPVSVFAHEFVPRDFKMIHYLHVSHLKNPDTGLHGELVSNRLEAFRDLEQFDLVAVQSEQQLNDLAKLGLSKTRMRILPSEIPPEAITYDSDKPRDEDKGLIVARLVELKQIDHAIQAVAIAREGNRKLTFDIYGEGAERAQLEQLTDELHVNDCVTLQGHVNDLPERLANASFSVLTSKYEGLPLAVRESMAAGCIPITYDITYGPRDIITHGVNGYIVPYGDTEALAAQISEFLNLEVETKNMMRAAAVERAKDFLSENIYPKWKSALEEPVKVHDPKPFLDEEYLRVRDITVGPTSNGARLSIVFADKEEVTNKNLRLVVAGRKKNTFFQAISSPDGWQRTDGRTAYNFTLPNALFSQSSGQTFDVYVRKIGAKWDSKVRLKLPANFTKIEDGRLRWFRTEYGNSSVKVLDRAAAEAT